MKSIKLTSITTALLLSGAAAQADVSISNKPTRNMTCDAGVCVPTASQANLNVGDVTSLLASGDLTVQTGNGDHTTASITVSHSFSWVSTSRLTLKTTFSLKRL